VTTFTTHLVPLDETPTIHINNQALRPAILPGASKQIEPTNPLPKRLHNILRPAPLILRKLGDEASLFAVRVTTNQSIDYGRFTGLSMGESRSDRVDLDVFCVIYVDEFFVDERTGRSWVNKVRVELGTLVSDLSRHKQCCKFSSMNP
jgi:hypothetical protein